MRTILTKNCVSWTNVPAVYSLSLIHIFLLLPAGILLPLIANHKIKWYQALVIGILMSATIELSQLIFMRGLFEWDDMIHNGLGCMAGCLFTNNFVKSGVKH